MASTRQVLDAMGSAIGAAVNAATLVPATPTKVFPGWPNQDDLTQVVKAKGQQISLYPLPGMQPATEWLQPNTFTLANVPTPTLTAAIAGKAITFGGVAQGGLNLHVIVKLGGVFGQYDVLVQTTGADTLATIASKAATAVNGGSIPGVSASASGAVTTLTGPVVGLKVNIGQTSVAAYQMARRMKRRIQVTVWSWSPDVRDQTVDIILAQVANKRNPWLQAADGTWVKLELADDVPTDAMGMETQFIHHTIYSAEYTQLMPVPATQVGVTKLTITPTNGPAAAPSFTLVDGG